ncbi:MAG: hypothetical protein ACE5EX_03900 [Phycisphaerae bacterium]
MLATARVAGAASLPPLVLQRRVMDAFVAVHRFLATDGPWHPIRIWNVIPDIRAVTPDGLDRYKVFNAGRFAAYHDWYRLGDACETILPTATGIGYPDADLVIHVLAADRPGTPVENPRQAPSYRYSRRYGPMPPCFARATITPSGLRRFPDLLVGGTASVRGQDSVCADDVAGQAAETIENLGQVIRAAQRVHRAASSSRSPVDESSPLRRFESLRIYYLEPGHLETILEIIRPSVDHLNPTRIEVVRADLCRPELLVEIEGTASLA